MTSIARSAPDETILARRLTIVQDLGKLVSPGAMISNEDGCRTFDTDALTIHRCMPLAVVLPTTTEEVSRVLEYCHERRIKVVARGAGTCLSGAALPAQDAVVVGLSRMNRVLRTNYENRTVRVEAGITNQQITDAVSGEGFFYAPDPASQLACTLAGDIAMNAGGAHALKYGVTTNNVLGVRIVLMTGEVLDIGGDFLDAPGYDLLGLVVGSEGQFGIVTEAIVRVLKAPEGARPILLGFYTPEAAVNCAAAIIATGVIPAAIEYMDQHAIQLCEEFSKAGYPLDTEALLIVEVEGSEGEVKSLLEKLSATAAPFSPTTVRISKNATDSTAIWKGHKSAYGAVGRVADYFCMDGTIPLTALPKALSGIARICDTFKMRMANIIRAGDGNLKAFIMYDTTEPGELEKAQACGAEILKLCVDLGGCLSGEHGVGIEKRDLMTYQFSDIDLVQQMRVKDVFDPDWLMNPDKVFPLDLRTSH